MTTSNAYSNRWEPPTNRDKQLDSDSVHHSFQGMIGKSHPISEVFTIIRRVAPTTGSVLIYGESGTGKEMVAKAIHQLSPRKREAFLACDCSALAPALLESEIFGHVRGAFSGAIASKPGLFELADKGTLFLDELANISLETQSKLLRVLESRRVKRVGDTEEHWVDIRLISATNQNLSDLVRQGTFRSDLYFRLHVVPIYLPPLRERIGDIPRLASSFLDRARLNSPVYAKSFSPEALKVMQNYHWPGNVRELQNVVECLAILCDSDVIEVQHLPSPISGEASAPASPSIPTSWAEMKPLLHEAREAVEGDLTARFLEQALRAADNNVSLAAKQTGLHRTTFHILMKKCGLSRAK